MKRGLPISSAPIRKRGSILAVALFIVVLASFSALMLASTMRDHKRMDTRKHDFDRAFYAAESGIRSVVHWTNDQASYTVAPTLFQYIDMVDPLYDVGFISAADGKLQVHYKNLYDQLIQGPMVINYSTLQQMGLGSMVGNAGKSNGVQMEKLSKIILTLPKAGDPNYDPAQPTNPYGMNVYSIGESRTGVKRTVLAYLTLFPNLNVALGGALISMSGAGLGGNGRVHWGESWARGSITSLPSPNNMGHLDEKATNFDKWARYRSEGKISGAGMALTYLGGSGNWANQWSSTIPNSFSNGSPPNLFDGTKLTPIKGNINLPGWFPKNGQQQPASPPVISPSNPNAATTQPAPDVTDGRMTNAFLQNQPANSLLFPDFLHQHRSLLDFKTYYIFKNFAIKNSCYYTTDASGNIHDSTGAVVDFSTFQQNGSPEARLYFVDTIDGNPPAANGSNLANINIQGKSNGYAGMMYLCANLKITGQGNTNYTPPSHRPDGTTNYSNSEATDLGRVWLNGVLFAAGSMDVAGNPIIYGTVVTEKGITGSGTLDIYYNIDNRNGLKLSGENMPDRFTIVRQNNTATLPAELAGL